MRKHILFAFCFLLSHFANAQNGWSKLSDFCIDTAVAASNNIVHYNDDNVFIAAGQTYTPGVSTFHTYISTFDYSGGVLHSKNLYSPGVLNMIHTTNGERGAISPLTKVSSDKYLLIGYELDNYSNTRTNVNQLFFYFFNAKCDSLLLVKYSDTIISRTPFSVITDKQKNLIVCGVHSSMELHQSVGDYYYDTLYSWVAKYDSNANLLWSKRYFINTNPGNYATNPVSGGEEACKVILSNDSTSYIVSGSAYNSAKKWSEPYIMKIDQSGNVVWHKFLPRKYRIWHDIDITSLHNGSYAFVSTSTDDPNWLPGNSVHSFVYYGNINESGDTLWTKRFDKGTTELRGKQIAKAQNGDLLFFCNLFDLPYGYRNVLLRTSPTGEIKWYREYIHKDTVASTFTQDLVAFSYTAEKKILLSGKFIAPKVPSFFDSTGQFSWFVYTDTFGCIIPGCQLVDTIWTGISTIKSDNNINISIYPNPAKDKLFIKNTDNHITYTSKIISINGILLEEKRLSPNASISYDLADKTDGIYLLEIWLGNRKLKSYRISHY